MSTPMDPSHADPDGLPAPTGRSEGRLGGRLPGRLAGSWPDRLEVLLPWLGYLALVISGATTSSLGLLRRSLDSQPESQWGASLPIRSDEWLTAAPLELATLANGSSMTPPLSHGPDLIYQISSGSPFETILFVEGNLLRLGPWLPDAQLFAAFRGFSWLLLALALPPLLRRMGATRPLSWLAVVLCLAAPAALWWSFIPIRTLGFAAAGCYVLVLAADRMRLGHRGRALALAALAGLLLARLVTYYVPWSLTVGVPLVIATGMLLVWERKGRGAALTTIGSGAFVSLVLLVGTFWENRAALNAELNTLYPGLRRSSGEALPAFQLFGAPGLFDLEEYPTLLQLNQSEVSSAFLITAVVALVAWPWAWPHLAGRERAAVATLGVFSAIWGSWVMFAWGPVGESIPGLSSLLPIRAAQTLGFTTALMMCLILSGWSRDLDPSARTRRVRAATVGGVVAVITGYAVSGLVAVIPGLPAWQIWLVSLVTGALAAALVWHPRHWLPVAAVSVVVVVAGADANPVIFGLGDVRNTPAADRARGLRAEAVSQGTVVVTDSMASNALMLANGVPLLSGNQVTGPVREAWAEVDPDNRYEAVWNRGASYLLFSFDGASEELPEVIEEGPDVIRVRTEPCWLASSSFDVSTLVSSVKLTGPCVSPRGRFVWNGAQQFVYTVSPS